MTSLGRKTEATKYGPMGKEGDIPLIHRSEWTLPQTPYMLVEAMQTGLF